MDNCTAVELMTTMKHTVKECGHGVQAEPAAGLMLLDYASNLIALHFL